MENISFIGCGSWGGALSKVLSDKNIHSTMWHRNPSVLEKMEHSRIHYLVPELIFSEHVSFTNNLENLIENASVIILAVPSQSIRSVLNPYKHLINNNQIIVNLAKGIETHSLLTISGVLKELLGNKTIIDGKYKCEKCNNKFLLYFF